MTYLVFMRDLTLMYYLFKKKNNKQETIKKQTLT